MRAKAESLRRYLPVFLGKKKYHPPIAFCGCFGCHVTILLVIICNHIYYFFIKIHTLRDTDIYIYITKNDDDDADDGCDDDAVAVFVFWKKQKEPFDDHYG